MAWLQNLAGKAEDLLNKIDKNAANVLTESNAVNNSTLDTENAINVIEPQVFPSESVHSLSSLVIIDETDFLTNETQIEIEPVSQENVDFEGPAQDTPGRCSSTSSNDKFKIFERIGKADSTKMSSNESSNFLEERKAYEEKVAKLSSENEDLNQKLLNMQHNYLTLKNEYSNLEEKTKLISEMCLETQAEMKQCKVRAQRILLEKGNVSQTSSHLKDETDDQLSYLINSNDNLRKEIEFYQNENKDLNAKLSNLTHEVNTLQQQTIYLQSNTQESHKSLQETILQERALRVRTEEEVVSKINELQGLKVELGKFQNLIGMKESEIERLNNYLKSLSNVTGDNSDERFHTLTKTLMTKQDRLETVTTERNALKIQLEKLEESYNLLSKQKQLSPQKNIIKSNGADDVPRLLHLSPMDVGMRRKVKQTYSTLDTLSIRTGVFLRRYPLVRIFVFCYIVLLHIWVLLILFTYVPTTR